MLLLELLADNVVPPGNDGMYLLIELPLYIYDMCTVKAVASLLIHLSCHPRLPETVIVAVSSKKVPLPTPFPASYHPRWFICPIERSSSLLYTFQQIRIISQER
jgi:hypothetical protein